MSPREPFHEMTRRFQLSKMTVPELRQLQACLQRHVIEEESELFAHAQVVFDPPQLRMLAAEFTAAKKRYSPLPVGW